MDEKQKRKDEVPPPVISDQPEAELEEKLRQNPKDKNAKIDVGSDESMDASDPPSATRDSDDEPAPSSGYPEAADDRSGSSR